jgi:alpha-L-fucosidase
MDVNGESIFGTEASPLEQMSWGECTKKEIKNHTILYLSVFNWPGDMHLFVPGLQNKVISAKLLSTGGKLYTSMTANGLNISIPASDPDPVVSVIRLEVKGKVGNGQNAIPGKKMQSGALD